MNQVTSEIVGGLWIDCTDQDEEGKWVCAEDEEAGIGYRNWRVEQPNDWSPNSDQGSTGADFSCLEVGTPGFWSDYSDQPEYSLCEMKSTCLQCCIITAENDCHQ